MKAIIFYVLIGWVGVVSCVSGNSTKQGRNNDTENVVDSNAPVASLLSESHTKLEIDTSETLDTNKTKMSSMSIAKQKELGVRQQRIMSFHDSYEKRTYIGKSSIKQTMGRVSKNIESAYSLMAFAQNIGGLLAMYEATDSISYMEEATDLVSQIIEGTQLGKDIGNNPKEFKDNYRGWVNDNPKKQHGGGHLQEVPLFEGRFLRYVAKMVYILETSRDIKDQYPQLARKGATIHTYLEKNGWEKWYVRGERKKPGCYPYLFPNRTHIVSHWAIVALYLRELTTDPKKREQYNVFLKQYDKQLRDNFRLIKDNNSYIWNMTWDSPWPFNTKCNKAAAKSVIQDVDHGNHVVAYIVESYQLKGGKEEWKRDDIKRLSNTVKYILYDKKENRFYADLNKQYKVDYADGVRMSDGFLSLMRYDSELFGIVGQVWQHQYNRERFRYNEPQYFAEMLLAEKYLTQVQ